ncbi:MAG: YraN family protein [Alphaproteobacteria bacterium]|jgi:putative endonuclease|nr:YraN family protein [Candidatus Jidaibacter sp.]
MTQLSTLKKSTYDYGVRAEDIVSSFYKSLGFEELSRRYKTPYGEIDIILKKENLIVFAEVKARSKRTAASDVITQKQVRRSVDAASFYIASLESIECDFRFDLLILEGESIARIIENAWTADC